MDGEELKLNPLFIRNTTLEKTGEMIHREKFRKAGINDEEF